MNSVFAENFVRVIILVLLTASVLTLIATLLSIAISNIRKKKVESHNQHSLVYLAVFGAIFLFVLISLGLLVLNQLKAVETSGSMATESFISLITICISFATLVPFFVTKALTNSEVERKVQDVVDDNVKRIRASIDKESRYAVSRLNTSDADISRMVGYLLMTNARPDYFWSLSWLARAVKARMIASEETYQKTGRHEVSGLFMSHCVRFIVFNLVNIYDLSKQKEGAAKGYLDKYMTDFETSYTGTECPDLTRQCTLARLLRDYVALLEDIRPRVIFNVKDTELGSSIQPADIKDAIIWLCLEIRDYLAAKEIHVDDVAFRVLTFEEKSLYKGVSAKLETLSNQMVEKDIDKVMTNLKEGISGCDALCLCPPSKN